MEEDEISDEDSDNEENNTFLEEDEVSDEDSDDEE